ncbi:MAG: N-acetyltransferase [Dysgonamonadaceae bacterium]
MEIKAFSEINLDDPFFDSLKDGYSEFVDWFERKVVENAIAYVQYDPNNNIAGFLYLKIETGTLDDIEPSRPNKKRLKVGTFKVNPHGTRFGERFVKKIMDKAIVENVDEVYVTVFDEHDALIGLLGRYGFINGGTKTTANGTEQVLIKEMRILFDNVLLDYPLIQSNNRRKFALSIYPEYHTKLFPDSILRNESYNLIEDISHTNSIHKIYICFMRDINLLRLGDIIAIYRTKDNLGSAHYRSVITSVCVVEEVKTKNDFANVNEFIEYANAYSIFERDDLIKWFNQQRNLTVIKMTYNIALNRRITKQILMDELGINPEYWGFFRLTDEQFNQLLDRGEVYENIIIN